MHDILMSSPRNFYLLQDYSILFPPKHFYLVFHLAVTHLEFNIGCCSKQKCRLTVSTVAVYY